jgi:hypothetical protein
MRWESGELEFSYQDLSMIVFKMHPRILLKIIPARAKMTVRTTFWWEGDMIDIRALETFQKFAGWLSPPLLLLAYMYHCEMLDENYIPSAEAIAQFYNDGLLAWALGHPYLPIQILSWTLFLGGFIWLFAGALISLQYVIVLWIEPYVPFPFLTLTGLVCLLAGIVFITSLLLGTPISSFNPFWYLGLLCYGLDILDTAAG